MLWSWCRQRHREGLELYKSVVLGVAGEMAKLTGEHIVGGRLPPDVCVGGCFDRERRHCVLESRV